MPLHKTPDDSYSAYAAQNFVSFVFFSNAKPRFQISSLLFEKYLLTITMDCYKILDRHEIIGIVANVIINRTMKKSITSNMIPYTSYVLQNLIFIHLKEKEPLRERKSCTCAHILAYLVASSYTLQRWYSSKLFQGDGHFCRYIIFYSNGQLYENAFFFFFISSPPIKSAIIHTSFVHVTFR